MKSSIGMKLSALQPFWIATILFCWNVKPLKLPRVTLKHVCGTNSHNRRAKGQPRVGVVKIFSNSDSSGWKSFLLSDSTALVATAFNSLTLNQACKRIHKQTNMCCSQVLACAGLCAYAHQRKCTNESFGVSTPTKGASTPTKVLICRKFRKELSIFFNNADEITFVFYWGYKNEFIMS